MTTTKQARKTLTCRCSAYPFPHRWSGGKCNAKKPQQFTDEENELAIDFSNYYERLIIRDAPEFEYDYYLDKE